ncbi:2Fe-2S iron-sulfur cluster-binding protein [Acidocella sp.]|uniref:2Fe-2S iron-sulfur cluster-binding protein n=1 Tax=Acidocella sp. TaxID=50710 RepID=UPI00261A0550|nr:2Fe-2S iron-sulfur cluster-binding protein [Acidocella sp.]
MTYKITVEGAGEATCYEDERALVAMERAQGFGRLRGLARKLPVGCRRGGCGICRVLVLEGDYRSDPMSRSCVSAEDEARGLVLSCAIYPLSDLTVRLETPCLNKPGILPAAQTSGE